MKLGDVMRKEREAKGLNRHNAFSVEDMAEKLEVSSLEYEAIERGESSVEKWFPLLCQIAVKLKVPTSRLLAKSGKSEDTQAGNAGTLIRLRREDRGSQRLSLGQAEAQRSAGVVLMPHGRR